MSKIFNFKRFGKYFRYDIVSAWQNAGVTLLAIAAMPLWIFAIQQLFSIVFAGEFAAMPMGLTVTTYILSFLFAIIFFPVQHYGRLTDKKAGSDWLLIPASRFEKFLSMLLLLCVIVPVVWLAVIAACDGALYLIFGTYPEMGIKTITSGLGAVLAEFHSENIDFAVSGPYATYLSWCGNILTFALGAILFRKNKVVLTFLCMMGIGLFITICAGIAFGGDVNISPEDINEDRLMHLLNMTLYILYVVEFALLDLGIFFRIKSLKH